MNPLLQKLIDWVLVKDGVPAPKKVCDDNADAFDIETLNREERQGECAVEPCGDKQSKNGGAL